MKLKPILKAIALVAATNTAVTAAIAAPITPDEALGNAREAIYDASSHSSSARRISAATPLNLQNVYTAREGNKDAFYVFADNNAGVFSIVTADTRLPKVLGYSLSSGFNPDNIPCCMRWWLDSYAQQIGDFLASNPPEVNNTRAIEPDARQEVSPLVTTKWDQSAPYNKFCPAINGQNAVTGCVATAMAQIMKYHNWPPKGNGKRNGHSFDEEYEWNNMVDAYTGNFTNTQANAVAQLMVACGKAVDMEYTAYASGAMAFKLQYAFPTYFDYSNDIRYIQRDMYSQTEWEDIIYSELAAGRPVIYNGQAPGGGHSFVCDGYSQDGFFHINWGWSGMSDNYFRLYALNPSSNGIGGFDGGYNAAQTAIINIQKNNGSTDKQIALFASGDFSYVDDTFMIKNGSASGLIYNPLEETIHIYAGVRIIDKDGNIVGVATDPEPGDIESYHGFPGYTVEFPTLEDGEYHLYPVYSLDASSWMPIMIPKKCQNRVDLTVTNGEMKFINPGADIEKANLVASDIIVSPYASEGCPTSFRSYITNISDTDFSGNIYVIIKNSEGSRVDRFSISSSIAAHRDDHFVAVDVLDIVPGDYTVELQADNASLLCEPVKFTLGNFLSKDINSSKVRVSFVSPFYYAGSTPNIVANIRNLSGSDLTLNYSMRVRSEDGKDVYISQKGSPLRFPQNYNGNFTFRGFQLGTIPGDYILDMIDGDGNPISLPYPLTIRGYASEYEDVHMIECSNGNYSVTHPSAGEYSETVNIENVQYFYTFTELEGNAFTKATTLKRVNMPSTITRIQAAQFWNATSLNMIATDATEPFSISAMAMPENRFADVVLKVPAQSANTYKRTPIWDRFNIPGWNFNIDPAIAVKEGLLKDANDEIFAPYYVEAEEPLKFEMLAPAGKCIKITTTIPGQEDQVSYSFDGVVTLPAIAKGLATARFELADPAAVDQLPDNVSADVYTIDGILILKDADSEALRNLPAGFYIYGKQVIIIK